MSQVRGADGTVGDDSPGDETDDNRAGTTSADSGATIDDAARGEAVGAEGRDETAVAEVDGAPADGDRAGGDRRRTAVTVAALTAVLAVPLVIATVAVRNPRWYPLVDMSQIEMRVRDVGTGHPPMVGLGGRIFGLDVQGSHPGPLSFYVLAPVYRVLGSSSWALQASAATLNIAALATTVWVAHRRAGLRGALAVAAGLALVMRMYGTTVLMYPWNPYMPVLFWALFLVCVWCVLCDDVAMLPVAVVAGCICAQTHLPYVSLVGGMAAVVTIALVIAYRRARGDVPARRRILTWTAASAALGVLLWMPVFIEELGGDPGNLSVILDSIRHSTDQPIGAGPAWELFTKHLDVVRLIRGDRQPDLRLVSQVPGTLLLVLWAASAVVAVRLRDRGLMQLHVVVAAALALGYLTMSQIFGVTWFYLTLWAFGTAALTVGAIAATAVAAARPMVERRVGEADRERLGQVALAALALAVVVPTLLLARAAPDTRDADHEASQQLGEVVQPTVDAIEDGSVPGGGADGTFIVTWVDPVNLGGQGLGLMLELERRGYDARATQAHRLSVRDHRVVSPGEADAEIHLAAGLPAIETARARPGGRQIAFYDPRTDSEIARYERNRAIVVDGLEAAGLHELVPQIEANLFVLAADTRVPGDLARPIYIMGTTPQPVAVFTWAPGT